MQTKLRKIRGEGDKEGVVCFGDIVDAERQMPIVSLILLRSRRERRGEEEESKKLVYEFHNSEVVLRS